MSKYSWKTLYLKSKEDEKESTCLSYDEEMDFFIHHY